MVAGITVAFQTVTANQVDLGGLPESEQRAGGLRKHTT